MKKLSIPGFTADASLNNKRCYSMSTVFNRQDASVNIQPALDNAPPRKLGYIDCKEFPHNITCNECNAFGSGTINCCQLQGADDCIINNPPESVIHPPSKWGSVFNGFGRLAL
ncbi:MAG: hypothetical protein ABL925_21580 [Methylococcales bacterium]